MQATLHRFKRFLPLLILFGLLGAMFATGLNRYVSLDALKENRQLLQGFVAARPALALLIYIGIYTGAVAVSLPAASLLTLIGGFLFGPLLGGAAVVVGATAGATIVYLAARRAAGDSLKVRLGGRFAEMEAGFRKDAFNYLLILRLIPIFPFWLINLAAGPLGATPRQFVAATAIGIVPGCFIYAGLGDGLGAVFEAGAQLDMGIIFAPRLLLPLLGLAGLALVPVVWKWRKS